MNYHYKGLFPSVLHINSTIKLTFFSSPVKKEKSKIIIVPVVVLTFSDGNRKDVLGRILDPFVSNTTGFHRVQSGLSFIKTISI